MADDDSRFARLERELTAIRQRQDDLARLLAELRPLVAGAVSPPPPAAGQEPPPHAKRLIKDGMSAFFAGQHANPHAEESPEHEWWQYGHDLSADSWTEMAKG